MKVRDSMEIGLEFTERCLLRSKQCVMSEQNTIKTEAQLREAIASFGRRIRVELALEEWQPRHERGLDAIGELALDKRRITSRGGSSD